MTIKRKHSKAIVLVIMIVTLTCLLSATAFAITESEVQAQVSSQGREAVSGNVFIWFLCAIAFLKVSQKIDSFMSSLGINVGHTGGSMVAEMMMAGRAISGAMGKGGFGRSSGGGASSGSSASSGGRAPTNPLQGGLAGVVSRKVQGGAVTSATDSSGAAPSGGIMSGIGGKVFQSSLNKGGDYANNVIGAVAKGNMSQMGSITGDKAASALKSYMNVGGASNTVNSSVDASSEMNGGFVSVDNSVGNGIPTAPTESADPGYINVAGGTVSAASTDGVVDSGNIPTSPSAGAPEYSGVEIGGGRITGYETPAGGGDARQFAMYSADQYTKPDGSHDVATAVDGSKWYRQYAQPAVEKTPFMDEGGAIQYSESIVQKMPSPPRRKDRI